MTCVLKGEKRPRDMQAGRGCADTLRSQETPRVVCNTKSSEKGMKQMFP